MQKITEKEIYQFIKGLIEFPNGQVCKHYVCANLLDFIEKKGAKLDSKLVESIVNAEDETSIKLLDESILDI